MACLVEARGSHWAVEGVHHSHSRLDLMEADSNSHRVLLVQMGVVGRSLDCNLLEEGTRFGMGSLLHTVGVVVAGMAVVENSFEALASSSEEDSLLDVAASRESLVQGSTTSFRALWV